MKQKRSGGERYIGTVLLAVTIGMVVMLVGAAVSMVV